MTEELQEEVVERARAAWPEEGMAEDKWTAVRTALTLPVRMIAQPLSK